MHGPVAFTQTTSQVSLVFSVMTTVVGMTPQMPWSKTVRLRLASASSASRAAPPPPGAEVGESVQLPAINSSADINRREYVHRVVITDSLWEGLANMASPRSGSTGQLRAAERASHCGQAFASVTALRAPRGHNLG